jgi:hypothetical protein
VFGWCYKYVAYGPNSREYAEAMVKANAYMDVLASMKTDEQREEAKALLRREGLDINQSRSDAWASSLSPDA